MTLQPFHMSMLDDINVDELMLFSYEASIPLVSTPDSLLVGSYIPPERTLRNGPSTNEIKALKAMGGFIPVFVKSMTIPGRNEMKFTKFHSLLWMSLPVFLVKYPFFVGQQFACRSPSLLVKAPRSCCKPCRFKSRRIHSSQMSVSPRDVPEKPHHPD